MTDEQRTDSLGCYRSPWARTPRLDQLANEGVVFTNAVTPAPVCTPARVSLLTGRYPSETGVWWNENHGKQLEHLVYRFADAGYRTASFGKQHYASRSKAFQTEQQLILSDPVSYFDYAPPYDRADFDVVRYPSRSPWLLGGRYPAAAAERTEARSVQQAIKWLERGPSDDPFFLRISFNGPHTPVVPPAPFHDLIASDAIELPAEADAVPEAEPRWVHDLAPFCSSSPLSREQIEKMRSYYYGEVAFLDSQFGVLLDWMHATGLLANTIVAFISDHGTHLGDYGLVQKQTFYEPVVGVPFFLRWPGHVMSNVTIDTPVETRRLLPTLLELADMPGTSRTKGDSLAGVLRGEANLPSGPVFSELQPTSFGEPFDHRVIMVRDGDWKLTMRFHPAPGDRVIVNLDDDPYERQNLVGSHPDVVDRLEALINAHLREHLAEPLP